MSKRNSPEKEAAMADRKYTEAEKTAEAERQAAAAGERGEQPFICNLDVPADVTHQWVYAQDALRGVREKVNEHLNPRERKDLQEVLDTGRRMSEEIVERREELDNLKRYVRGIIGMVERLREASGN